MKVATPVLFLFFLAAAGFSATITVPTDYATIQEAIDAADDGDTVLVLPGTYLENIDFKGLAITVKSQDGPAVTVIDGGSPTNPDHGSVATFGQGEGSDSVLEGFTLTNGTGTIGLYGRYYGGGIHCTGASPTLRENRITANVADRGAGIFCEKASPAIVDNEIVENVSNEWGGHGAGIRCLENSSPLIEGNRIAKNEIVQYGWGGGVALAYDCHPSIAHNVIEENVASGGAGICCMVTCSPVISENVIKGNVPNGKGGQGGGLLVEDHCSPVITGNLIAGNQAQGGGGGMYCNFYCNPIVRDNTISGNSASYGGGMYLFYYTRPVIENNALVDNKAHEDGGAMYFEAFAYTTRVLNNTLAGNRADNGVGGVVVTGSSEVTVTNTILWDNHVGAGPEIGLLDTYWGPGELHIGYCDLDGGAASVHADPGSALHWEAGMVDGDPRFADPNAGDHHLLYTSPCRDAGHNGAVGSLTRDMEGDPRIASGVVDMGYDEFHTHLYAVGEAVPGGTVLVRMVGAPASVAAIYQGQDVLDPPRFTSMGPWYLAPPLTRLLAMTVPAEGLVETRLVIPAPAPPVIPLQGHDTTKVTNLWVIEME